MSPSSPNILNLLANPVHKLLQQINPANHKLFHKLIVSPHSWVLQNKRNRHFQAIPIKLHLEILIKIFSDYGIFSGLPLTMEEDPSGNPGLYHWRVWRVRREDIPGIHIPGGYSLSLSRPDCKGWHLPEHRV